MAMRKKYLLKLCVVLLVVLAFSFSDLSFAEDLQDPKLKFGTVAWALDFAISILSWIWVLFAKIAWEFLTNKWVYGWVVWIDTLLWKYRNVMKNIANFGLWFYFVYVIFKSLIDKADLIKKIKDSLLWIVVAWIWIQSSRFLTAAIIDVSTITLVAAGSFPAQVISQNSNIKEEVYNAELYTKYGAKWYAKVLELFPDNEWANKILSETVAPLTSKRTLENLVDDITPKADNVAWPFYFIWYELLSASSVPKVSTASESSAKETIINLIIQWWTTVVYSIEMLVICVLAFMRVLYLWMFIVLSPIVVLVTCIDQIEKNKWWEKWFLSSIMKQVNLKSFLINVFKPTIIVLWISVALMFSFMVNGVLKKDAWENRPINIGWVTISSNSETSNSWEKSYTTSVKTSMTEYVLKGAWKPILDVILSIIVVVLVYMVIDIAIKMWWSKDFVSENVGTLQESVWKMMGSTPVIPVASYDKNWFESGVWAISRNNFKTLGENKIGNITSGLDNSTRQESDELMKMWWLYDERTLTETMKKGIENAWGSWVGKLEAMKAFIRDPKNNILSDKWKWKWLYLDNPNRYWASQIENWLNTVRDTDIVGNSPWSGVHSAWESSDKKLENFFGKHTKYAKAYATTFGISGAEDWDHIKNKDISEK